MYPHTTRQVAEKLVTFGFFAGDSNFERGIRITFDDHADEFNYVLRHEESRGKSRQILAFSTVYSKLCVSRMYSESPITIAKFKKCFLILRQNFVSVGCNKDRMLEMSGKRAIGSGNRPAIAYILDLIGTHRGNGFNSDNGALG